MAVYKVCIDDFAIKKRQRYGTIMVDMESHKIVDMLESRERANVSEWLKQFPNIKIVSRDGSHTYRQAIAEAHPIAIQVSDRFHLIKSLCDRARDAFQKLFQGRIAIPATTDTSKYHELMLMGTVAQRIKLVKKLHKSGKSQSEICLITGASERIVRKYILMSEDEIPAEKQTNRGTQHEQAILKVEGRIQQVQELHKAGESLTYITQKTGFSAGTVRRYLNENFFASNAHYGKNREGKLAPFRDEVYKLRLKGLKYREIHEILKGKGYTGTMDAIRGFISKERRIRRDLLSSENTDVQMEFIDKKWIIALLYKPFEKLKGITSEQLIAVFEAYPLCKDILDIINEFRVILKSKDEKRLLRWIDKAASLGVSEINSFLKGLSQDMVAVKNAVLYDYSNGLAEGTVNKIKVAKRIMYGRCSFDTLKNKCLLLDSL